MGTPYGPTEYETGEPTLNAANRLNGFPVLNAKATERLNVSVRVTVANIAARLVASSQ